MQEVLLRMHSDHECILVPQNAINNLGGECRTPHLIFKHVTCFQLHEASKLFSDSSVVLSFSQYRVKG